MLQVPNMLAHSKRYFPLALMVFLITACDPSVTFTPREWTEVSSNKWSHSFGDIEVEAESFGGMWGSPFVNTAVTIKNHSAEKVFVTKAVLKVHDQLYESKPLPTVGVDPGDAGKFGLWFDLPDHKTIRDCLNSDIADIVLNVRSGESETRLIIPYGRSLF